MVSASRSPSQQIPDSIPLPPTPYKAQPVQDNNDKTRAAGQGVGEQVQHGHSEQDSGLLPTLRFLTAFLLLVLLNCAYAYCIVPLFWQLTFPTDPRNSWQPLPALALCLSAETLTIGLDALVRRYGLRTTASYRGLAYAWIAAALALLAQAGWVLVRW